MAKTKEEIIRALEEIGVAGFADVVERRRRIYVPPHRIIEAGLGWNQIADKLEALGFQGRGYGAMSIEFEAAPPAPPAPTPAERYASADEQEQIEMDLGWLEIGGHLSEEKMERLRRAGKIK